MFIFSIGRAELLYLLREKEEMQGRALCVVWRVIRGVNFGTH